MIRTANLECKADARPSPNQCKSLGCPWTWPFSCRGLYYGDRHSSQANKMCVCAQCVDTRSSRLQMWFLRFMQKKGTCQWVYANLNGHQIYRLVFFQTSKSFRMFLARKRRWRRHHQWLHHRIKTNQDKGLLDYHFFACAKNKMSFKSCRVQSISDSLEELFRFPNERVVFHRLFSCWMGFVWM